MSESRALVCELRRRREASRRLPVLEGCAYRDPLDGLAAAHTDCQRLDNAPGPSTFGLSELELRREVERLMSGEFAWSGEEVRAVLADPRTAVA